MSLRFSVLASGSSGNVSLVESHGQGVLLDLGLGPRTLADRLKTVNASWHGVRAALLTHIHTDHWNERSLVYFRKHGIVLYCHANHQRYLEQVSPAFLRLCEENLVRHFEIDASFPLLTGLNCRPLVLPHDGGMTFGFAFEGAPDLFGEPWRLGYLADLGSWNNRLVEALANVDVLAVEFNHDVNMEKNSGRSPRLIARVLGDKGHLSNVQAASFVQEILHHSAPGRLRHLVQLHLSRHCNRQDLARLAAQEVMKKGMAKVEIHTACQDVVGPCLVLGHHHISSTKLKKTPSPRRIRRSNNLHPKLPGVDW